MRSVQRLGMLAMATAAVALSGCVLHGSPPATASDVDPVTQAGRAAEGSDAGAAGVCGPGPDSHANYAGPLLFLQVSDGSTPQAGLAVRSMHEWKPYDGATSDASGCVAFGARGAGEYEFATDGGGCERQGTVTLDWDGSSDAQARLVVGPVCQAS